MGPPPPRPARPPREYWRRIGGCFVFGLALLVVLYGASYFVLGVDAAFMLGLVRSLVNQDPTPADVTAVEGISVSVWADGLSAPTSITFGPDGRLYVAEVSGRVLALSDPDGSGQADPTHAVFATGLASPLGLAFYRADLFVGRRSGVTRLSDRDGDGVADEAVSVLEGLPAGRHQTDSLAFGPDGRLYISQGSTSDRGETGRVPLEASILVAERDGSGLRVFAAGTRNPFDLAFYPDTDLLFATDNGRDVPARGVPDELNLVVDGGHYGWPDCWATARGNGCAGTLAPVAEFAEHVAVAGLSFYTGDMFPQWRNQAFVALYGANSGDPTIGRKVQRVALVQANGGWRGTVYDFAIGFDRPVDVTEGPDGALYVADFGAGIIYRLASR